MNTSLKNYKSLLVLRQVKRMYVSRDMHVTPGPPLPAFGRYRRAQQDTRSPYSPALTRLTLVTHLGHSPYLLTPDRNTIYKSS